MWIWSDSGATQSDTLTFEQPSAPADIRLDLVQRVRREIAEGLYDTPEKWEAALDNLFDRLEQ